MPDSASGQYERKKRKASAFSASSPGLHKLKAALVAVLGLALLSLGLLLYMGSPAGGGEKVIIKIEPQSTTSEIAAHLEDSGLIHSAFYFKLYTRISGADKFLKAGRYEFNGNETLSQVVEELKKGTPELISFTVPEGFTLEQVINLLDSRGIVAKGDFLQALEEEDIEFPFLDELPQGQNKLEGFLFPDTYNVTEGMKAGEILQMMLDRFAAVYSPDLWQRAQELDMTTVEVVTLASIIEREAKKPEERALVSAVFHNRLKKGMALQSCATVQYALGENKPVLYNIDLQVDSPYNTYKHPGLPPGPIACPGEESIKAALFPEDVSFLYFVAKPDGSHSFSNTLAEHNAAKKKYLP